MTGPVVAACLVAAAAVVAWPGSERARLRRVFAAARGQSRRRLSPWRFGRDLPAAALVPGSAGWVLAALLVPLLVAAWAAGGPVAAGAAAAYGGVAAMLARDQQRHRRDLTRRRDQLDLVGAAAADLRAGLPVGSAIPDLDAGAALGSRVQAVVTLAERTGAPLAELLERIEADARAADRAGAAAAAQAAGARATAWLLAALPVGGIALGYAIGADPLAILLHTPFGAVCAGGAIALQVAGLTWSRRLVRAGQVAS